MSSGTVKDDADADADADTACSVVVEWQVEFVKNGRTRGSAARLLPRRTVSPGSGRRLGQLVGPQEVTP